MVPDAKNFADFQKNATEVAGILSALADERRLMILCGIRRSDGGVSVDAVGISQSALSQHLSKMRDEGIVTFRKESQTVWYRIADPRIEKLFATLHDLFCRTARKARKPRGALR